MTVQVGTYVIPISLRSFSVSVRKILRSISCSSSRGRYLIQPICSRNSFRSWSKKYIKYLWCKYIHFIQNHVDPDYLWACARRRSRWRWNFIISGWVTVAMTTLAPRVMELVGATRAGPLGLIWILVVNIRCINLHGTLCKVVLLRCSHSYLVTLYRCLPAESEETRLTLTTAAAAAHGGHVVTKEQLIYTKNTSYVCWIITAIKRLSINKKISLTHQLQDTWTGFKSWLSYQGTVCQVGKCPTVYVFWPY